MIIKNEELLNNFRMKRRCEWCGEYGGSGRDPHHINARGMGGGSRLDIAINLVSLCRKCHTASHAGKSPLRSELLKIVAMRENCTVAYIVEECARILALDKHSLLETVKE